MRSILLVLGIIVCSVSYGQNELSFKERLYYGGGVQASFSNQTVVLGASPFVGYKWTEKFSTGVGLSFVYFSVNAPYGRFQSTTYGGNVFGRYMFFDNFFAQTELHLVNSDVPQFDPNTGEVSQTRATIPMWYIGGGYRASLGGRLYATLTVLYDFIDHPYSPYSNPSIRGGIAIGL